jgi:hypothetical protein
MQGLELRLWHIAHMGGNTQAAAIGGPFQLTDQDGQTVTDQDFRGKSFLVFYRVAKPPRRQTMTPPHSPLRASGAGGTGSARNVMPTKPNAF